MFTFTVHVLLYHCFFKLKGKYLCLNDWMMLKNPVSIIDIQRLGNVKGLQNLKQGHQTTKLFKQLHYLHWTWNIHAKILTKVLINTSRCLYMFTILNLICLFLCRPTNCKIDSILHICNKLTFWIFCFQINLYVVYTSSNSSNVWSSMNHRKHFTMPMFNGVLVPHSSRIWSWTMGNGCVAFHMFLLCLGGLYLFFFPPHKRMLVAGLTIQNSPWVLMTVWVFLLYVQCS